MLLSISLTYMAYEQLFLFLSIILPRKWILVGWVYMYNAPINLGKRWTDRPTDQHWHWHIHLMSRALWASLHNRSSLLPSKLKHVHTILFLLLPAVRPKSILKITPHRQAQRDRTLHNVGIFFAIVRYWHHFQFRWNYCGEMIHSALSSTLHFFSW